MSEDVLRAEAVLDDPRADGWRVDRFLADGLALFSRSQARQRVIELEVNGRPAKLSRRLRAGDHLVITYRPTVVTDLVPEDLPLDVVYEDDRVLVVNKPQGLVVHPAAGHWSGTLVNALLWRHRALREVFGQENPRPGIVHRLDKDTSGLLAVAKDPEAHEQLARQFKDRSVRKAYLALVHGAPPASRGIVRTRIGRDPKDRKRFAVCDTGGRLAVTRYRVIRTIDGRSLVLFAPRTGRTHQIRVHARHLGCPIVGDPIYGRRDGSTLMLHAWRLTLVLPGQETTRVFTAPIPERFRPILSPGRTPGEG